MAKRDKAPLSIVTKTQRGLVPLGPMDAEQMYSDPMGTEYELVLLTKRSHPQLRLYWMMLHAVVKATGKWPDAEHLSDEIKFTLGYRRKVADMRTGKVTETVDSIALASMKHSVFMAYFEAALQLLAETLYIDPMAFLRPAIEGDYVALDHRRIAE